MGNRYNWKMRMAAGGALVLAVACERPERQGMPPEPQVEQSRERSREPDPAGGAPRPGPDTGPETPAQ